MPQFKLAAKEISLPTLGGRKGYDMMEQEKENRELAIEGEGSEEEESGYRKGGLFAKNNP